MPLLVPPSVSATPCEVGGPIRSIAWSPNGRTLALTTETEAIQLWDVISATLVNCYHGHTDRVSALTWSPSSRFVASASRDGAIHIWRVNRLQPVVSYRHTPDQNVCITALTWSRCGRYVASAGTDGTIRIWDVAAARTVHVLSAHAGAIHTIDWGPDHRLVSVGEDRCIHLWDAVTLTRPFLSFQLSTSRSVKTARYSPDGTLLAFFAAGCQVTLFSLPHACILWERVHGTNATLGWTGEPEEEGAGLGDLAFSSDGRVLASVGENGVPWLWDVSLGMLRVELHSAAFVNVLAFCPLQPASPSGLSYLVTGSSQGTLQSWPMFLTKAV